MLTCASRATKSDAKRFVASTVSFARIREELLYVVEGISEC